MRRLSCLAVLVVSCATGPTLPKPSEIVPPSIRFTMQDYLLPSGLRVLVQEDHSSPVVVIANVVGIGHGLDPAGKEGTAHLLEHLTFRAHHESKTSLADRFEDAGVGEINAMTAADVTTYYVAGARDTLPDLLALEGQRMADPLAGVDENMVATERAIVRNELRERLGTGIAGSLQTWIHSAVFPADHPYARSPSGNDESLARIALADVQKVAKLYYRPDNMTLMIAGDVDLTHIRELLSKTLPPRLIGDGADPIVPPRRRLVGEAPDPPPAPTHTMYRYKAAVTKPEVWIVWPLPGAFREESVVQEFVAAVGNALRYIKLDDHDIVDASIDVEPGTRATILGVRLELREGKNPQGSADKAVDALTKIWNISPWAVPLYRRYALNYFALGSEELVSRTIKGAMFTHFTGNPRYFARSNEAILTLRPDVVQEFTKRHLAREQARILYIEPDGRNLLGDAQAKAVAPAFGTSQGRVNEAEVGDEAEPAATHDAAALLTLARPPQFAQLRQTRLPNGMEVIAVRRPGLPMVTAAIGLHGGYASGNPRGVVELAQLTTSAEREGHDSALDYGAEVRGGAGEDLVLHGIVGFATAVEPIVALAADQVRFRKVSGVLVDVVHEKDAVAEARKAEDKPAAKAMREFWRALFGDHPFALTMTTSDIERIGRKDIEHWIDRVYHPSNAVLAVAGDVDPQAVTDAAQRWLGDWKGDSDGGVLRAPPPASTAPHPPRVIVSPVERASQAEIVLGCMLPVTGEDGEPGLHVLEATLRRHLERRLRRQLGVTYDVSASASVLRGGTAFLLVRTSIENASAAKALGEIRAYWRAMAAQGPDAADLDAARWEVARHFNLQFTTNAAVVATILDRRNKNWSLASLDLYPERLTHVTGEQLRTIFSTCNDTQVMLVAGNEGIVRTALREGSEK